MAPTNKKGPNPLNRDRGRSAAPYKIYMTIIGI